MRHTLISHVDNGGYQGGLVRLELAWSVADPLRVEVRFVREFSDLPDVTWLIGVEFLLDALDNGSAGDPAASACMAEVEGEDFVLTLRDPVRTSRVTLDLDQVHWFSWRVRLHAELDYSSEVDRFLNSLDGAR